MNYNPLIGGSNTSRPVQSYFHSHEEVKNFLNYARHNKMELRLDMTHEGGIEFEYTTGVPIMERTVDDMIELYYLWAMVLPSLESMIDIIVEGLFSIDLYDNRSIQEYLMEEVRVSLEEMGLYGEDLDATDDMLDILVEDMYDYLSFTIANFSLISDPKLWNFLKCIDASMSQGKLYITLQIYEEKINSVDLFGEEYQSYDYLETANAIKNVYDDIISRSQQTRDRSRSRGNDLIGSVRL